MSATCADCVHANYTSKYITDGEIECRNKRSMFFGAYVDVKRGCIDYEYEPGIDIDEFEELGD